MADHSGKFTRCIVYVKSGHASNAKLRDLVGTINREKAEMGLLVSLEDTTAPMRKEAAEAGWYRSEGWNRDYPKVQMVTIEELLRGKLPDMPPVRQTFSKAERITTSSHKQRAMASLFGEE